MNKNGESYSSAIESHRKRARYKTLLQAQKGIVDTCLEGTKLVEQKVTSLMSRFQTIPLQFYNKHVRGHQIVR